MNGDHKHQGREEAFRRLYERQRRQIVHLCSRNSHGDRARFNDLMQEVLICLWENIDKYDSGIPMWKEYVWVHFLTRKALWRFSRRQPAVTTLRLEDTDCPVAMTEGDRAVELLKELSAYLCEDDRRMVEWLCQGYSLGETAQLMGLTYATAQKRRQGIERKLYEIYQKLYHDGYKGEDKD